MRQKTFTLFAVILYLFVNAQDVSTYRALMQEGADSETAAASLVDKSKKAFEATKKPIHEAFYAMGNFMLAKHSSNPMRQFSYFKKGRTALDNAAKKEPANLEIRFLRFMTQERAPGFLGYNKDLKSDKAFMLAEYKKSTDQELIKRIKNHFKI
ncbi:hypothetical protein [Chryseobacterium sp. 6424]|uniref:hypothetical protein n=1 Tax=Chryseobacterium sp. 6424 TaxID=2039166 RepID=UPI0013CEA79F|nr:hypothetical protein [Chryseobacterium sp. 6424]